MSIHKKELLRKIIHLATLILPFSYKYYFNFNRKEAFFFFGLLLAAASVIEFIRLIHRPTKRLFYVIFGSLLRRHEITSISGATFLLISSLFSIYFFKPEVAFLAISFLIVGDTFAAIFGRRFGRKKIFKNKTFIGSLSCLISCFIFAYLFSNLPISIIAFGAFAAAAAELSIFFLDDNLAVPVISGIVMTVFDLII